MLFRTFFVRAEFCFDDIAVLCNICFQVHFSYNCLCFSELYMLFCIAQKFVVGLYSFSCCTCVCVVSDRLPDFGTDVQCKQRSYPC